MNYLMLETDAVDAGGIALLRDRQADHVRRVLRAGVGDIVRIGVLDSGRGRGVIIEDAGDDGIRIRCLLDETSLPPPRVDLLLAMPRPKVMKRLWATLAALGVGRIYLTQASKVERCYFGSGWLEPARVRMLLLEGLEQSGATELPEVRLIRRPKIFLEDELDVLFPDSTRLIAHPGTGRRMHSLITPETTRILLAVGPEGGWMDHELDLFGVHGFRGVTLGPRILRSETAVTALISLAYDALVFHGAGTCNRK